MGYTDKPDYQKLRSVLKEGLKSVGAADDDKLDFSASVNGAGPSAPKVRATFSNTSKKQTVHHHLVNISQLQNLARSVKPCSRLFEAFKNETVSTFRNLFTC